MLLEPQLPTERLVASWINDTVVGDDLGIRCLKSK